MCIFFDDDGAVDFVAELPPPLRWQLGGKLQSRSPFHNLQRHLKLAQRLCVGNDSVRQHESGERDIATDAAVLTEDDLEKVRRHSDIGRTADDLVRDTPAAVGVALGQVQWAGDDAHTGIAMSEAAAEVLEMGPVVAVEAVTDLWADVAKRKGRVHGRLRPLGVSGGDLMPAVVTAAQVVGQLGAEGRRDRGILDEDAVPPVSGAVG